MKIKKSLTVLLTITFLVALAAPVFAQDMTHSVDYDLDGTISLKKHVGHLCNTGAEMKQVITGAGVMTKTTDLYMKAGYLTVDDVNDWIAASTSSLTVTTAIELCAPPKYVFGESWDGETNSTPPTVGFGFDGYRPPWEGLPVPVEYLAALMCLGEDLGEDGWDLVPLTKQIWAAEVKADPGYSGNMHTDFTAAYGPFACFTEEIEPNGGPEWWWNEPDDDQWGFEGGFPADDVVLGEDYVGNYFTMDAWFRTSMGTTKRFVSLSSPFSHAYLTEDITVVGKSMIKEALELMNLPEGEEATTDWWDLF